MASEHLISDAKHYASRLRFFINNRCLGDVKITTCQEAVARHFYGYKSWQNLINEPDITPDIDMRSILSFAHKLWLDGRFDFVGVPDQWFEAMDWFGEEVPVIIRHMGFQPVAMAAFHCFTNVSGKENSVPPTIQWAYETGLAIRDNSDPDEPGYSFFQKTTEKTGAAAALELGGQWERIFWFQNYMNGQKKNAYEERMEVLAPFVKQFNDPELTKLLDKSLYLASKECWSLPVCAFIGLFDDGKALRKQIEIEGIAQAKWAIRYVLEHAGEAPMPDQGNPILARRELEQKQRDLLGIKEGEPPLVTLMKAMENIDKLDD